MARRMHDGTIRLDVSPDEARVLMAALGRDSSEHAAQAVGRANEARDRRELAQRMRRGRHANLRAAGELDAEAKRHIDRRDLALDMQRVLLPFVSASRELSRSQLPMPSQIEEDV